MSVKATSQVALVDVTDGQMLYATCSTEASIKTKVATLTSGTLSLSPGSTVSIKFTYENNVSEPELNIDGTGIKQIRVNGEPMNSSAYYWVANSIVTFVYDGTYWHVSDASALYKAAESAKTATNFMEYDSVNGLQIGDNSSGSWNGYRTQIKSDSFNVVDSNDNVLSTFSGNRIELGKNREDTEISMCDGFLRIIFDPKTYADLFGYANIMSNRMRLTSTEFLTLYSEGFNNTEITDGTMWPWWFSKSYIEIAEKGNGATITSQRTLTNSDGVAPPDNYIDGHKVYSVSTIDVYPTELKLFCSDHISIRSDKITIKKESDTSSENAVVEIKTDYVNITGDVNVDDNINVGKNVNVTGDVDVNGDLRIGGIDWLDKVYPINSIYLSYSHTSPASLFGGTWTRISNRFLHAISSAGTVGYTGGANSVTLSVANLPSHNHSGLYYYPAISNENNISLNAGTTSYKMSWYAKGNGKSTAEIVTGKTGSGTAFNIMPPYIDICAWRRTA